MEKPVSERELRYAMQVDLLSEQAVVLCIDEKIRFQALERSRPMLQMSLGYVEEVTHDCLRR